MELKFQEAAKRVRLNIVKMVAEARSGHPGGSLSATDLLTVLFLKHLDFNPGNWQDQSRDRFILSKGHAAPLLYAMLAEVGFIPEEELASLRKFGSRLQGHPDMLMLPYLEMSTGSLGQGLSAAAGIALSARLDNLDYYAYALLGDGEVQEGQIWEAAMFAGHYKLHNLIAILDNNDLQIDGDIRDIMDPHPLGDKFRAFNWHVQEIDGHEFTAIDKALAAAKEEKSRPSIIIAKTVKGKGVSFMENQAGWHGKAPNAEQLAEALRELEGR